jgi:hypothetical protein
VTINRSTRQYQPLAQARIEELVFPGFRTIGPQPNRPFPPVLMVKAVKADSEYGLGYAKEKVFDSGISPEDGITAWASADTPMPHWLEVELAERTKLTQVEVVN